MEPDSWSEYNNNNNNNNSLLKKKKRNILSLKIELRLNCNLHS